LRAIFTPPAKPIRHFVGTENGLPQADKLFEKLESKRPAEGRQAVLSAKTRTVLPQASKLLDLKTLQKYPISAPASAYWSAEI
jgi:hypothetical protein